MKCNECQQERGCGCAFLHVEGRDYRVCPDCKIRIEQKTKNETTKPNTQPNVQGV